MLLTKSTFLPLALVLGIAAAAPALAQSGKTKAAPAATAAANAEFEAAIAETTDLLGKNDLVPALAAARRAVQARPVNFKGHYYVTLILSRMENWSMAEDALRETMRYTTDDVLPDVQKLRQSIDSGRVAAQMSAAAQAAQEEGLNGKAADLFRQAWEAGYQRPHYAFSAAQLYAWRLSQPVAAGKLLREVLARSTAPEVTSRAQVELAALLPQLKQIAAAKLEAAQAEEGAARVQLLAEALDADPDHLPAYNLRARLALQAGDTATLKNVLLLMSRRNLLTPVMLQDAQYANLLKDAGFVAWLKDLMGSASVQQLLAETARLERLRIAKERYEQEMTAYREKVRQYHVAMEEHKKFQPCVAQAAVALDRCGAAIPKLEKGFLGLGSNEEAVKRMRTSCSSQHDGSVGQCKASYPEATPVMPVEPVAPKA